MLWQLESPDLGIFHLTQGQYTLGRRPENDMVIDEDGVSGHHAQIDCDGHTLLLRNLDSTNGVFINGKPVEHEGILVAGDRFSLGEDSEFEVVELEPPCDSPLLVLASPTLGHWCLPPGDYILGRDEQADIVIDESNVSRLHAKIQFDGRQVRLHDLNSTNGTFTEAGNIDEMNVYCPEVIWLGTCPLFLAHLEQPIIESEPFKSRAIHEPRPRPPPPSDELPAAAWVFLIVISFGAIGGAVWYMSDYSSIGVQTTSRTAAEIEQERQRQARIQRAHQTASAVAMDTELRTHLQALARRTEIIEETLSPIFNELDRIGDMLQQATSNPITRRMIAGTDLEPVANTLHDLTRNSRSFMNDLRRMPQDLNSLDQALSRYQSRPSNQTLTATIEPARRVLSQGQRIKRTTQSLEGSLGLTAAQLDRLAGASRNWRVGSELSGISARAARDLRNGQHSVGAYRQALSRDLQLIQRLEREVSAAAR